MFCAYVCEREAERDRVKWQKRERKRENECTIEMLGWGLEGGGEKERDQVLLSTSVCIKVTL